MKFKPFLFVTSFVLLSGCVTQSSQLPPPLPLQDVPPVVEEPRSEVRVIPVTSANWAFTPNFITVKRGEQVTIQLSGVSGVHGFAVPGLGINVPVSPGKTVSVAVPTAAAGSYDFFCSIPCGQGHRDMVGKIVIE